MIEKAKTNSGDTWRTANIFSANNRGMLFDILIFIANLYFMRLLTRLFIMLFRQASADDEIARLTLGVFFLGLLTLPALGATLKRWHFHERLKAKGKTVKYNEANLAGCLFNPVVYFCLNLVITMVVVALVGEQISRFTGKELQDDGVVFLPLIFTGLGFASYQTYLIYHYFSIPKGRPLTSFFLKPESEFLGDVCLFIQMILFQVVWNLMTFMPFDRISGLSDFIGRLFYLTFFAFLIYFPPRIFFLIEDINRPRTWLTVFLANSPVIWRILIGSNTGTRWSW